MRMLNKISKKIKICIFALNLAVFNISADYFSPLVVDIYSDPFCLSVPSYLYMDIYWSEGSTGRLIFTFVEDYETWQSPYTYDDTLINFDDEHRHFRSYQIPYKYMTDRAGIYIEILVYSTQIGAAARQFAGLYYGFKSSITQEKLIKKSESVNLGRNAFRSSSTERYKMGDEIFTFYNIDEDNKRRRNAGLKNIYFTYECIGIADDINFLDYTRCYVKIISHPDDFLIGDKVSGTRIIEAEILSKIDLRDGPTKNRNIFYIEPISNFYFNPIDFVSYPTSELAKGNSITTKEIMIPLFTEHEEEPFTFQVILEEVGHSLDTFIIERTVYPGGRIFGSCMDSEYCVLMGN